MSTLYLKHYLIYQISGSLGVLVTLTSKDRRIDSLFVVGGRCGLERYPTESRITERRLRSGDVS